jgi:glucosylceramidase
MKILKVFRSQKDSPDMLAEIKRAAPFIRDDDPESDHAEKVISVVPERRYQEIIGFGGAFTETSAYNFSRMNAQSQEKILKAYFDRETGHGYNFCRTHIHSCDFSLSRYTYVEEYDENLETFSIDRDRKYIIPFIKAAQKYAGDALYLFASPWSPPGWMKDNKDICHGGRLLRKYYGLWAKYIVKYFEAYQKENISFFGLTVQNEPHAWQTWESCQFTAEEEGVFVHEYLKPELVKNGFGGLKIMIWDHNKERVYERARDTFQVPGAEDDVWGVAFHWYSGSHFAALDMTREAFPNKPLILSEYCLGVSQGETGKSPRASWRDAEIYASGLIGDFNHFMAAEVDWNMVVDEDGGPFHDRAAGCKAQIVADPGKDAVSLETPYYAVAHFSRFIKRGAVRLGSSSPSEHIKAAAFANPDGPIVTVVLNEAEEDEMLDIRINGAAATITLPSRSLTTYLIDGKIQN